MKKIQLITLALVALSFVGFTNHSGGIFRTNTGNINFFSHTDVEDITADNHKVKTAFDATSGKIQFSVLVKDFEFPNALMQEHFNENYMQSTKFPKATFSGMITDIESVVIRSNGTYTSPVTGTLTIKGVAKEVSTTATFVVNNGVVNAKADFNINPLDFEIKIPKATVKKISNSIKVSIDADYKHSH